MPVISPGRTSPPRPQRLAALDNAGPVRPRDPARPSPGAARRRSARTRSAPWRAGCPAHRTRWRARSACRRRSRGCAASPRLSFRGRRVLALPQLAIARLFGGPLLCRPSPAPRDRSTRAAAGSCAPALAAAPAPAACAAAAGRRGARRLRCAPPSAVRRRQYGVPPIGSRSAGGARPPAGLRRCRPQPAGEARSGGRLPSLRRTAAHRRAAPASAPARCGCAQHLAGGHAERRELAAGDADQPGAAPHAPTRATPPTAWPCRWPTTGRTPEYVETTSRTPRRSSGNW